MAIFSHSTEPESAAPREVRPEDVRREIHQTLEELKELAVEEAPPAFFYEELLERVSRVTGATHAAVWIVGNGSTLHLFRHQEREGRYSSRERETHRRRFETWLQDHAAADSASTGILSSESRRGTSWVLAEIAPVKTTTALLSVGLDHKIDSGALTGIERFLTAVAAAASDYQGRRELSYWNQDRDALSRLHELAMAVHRPWSKRQVLAAAANEGRRFLDADRVAVAVRSRGRYRVVAASGAASLEKRSAEIIELDKLVGATMRTREALFYEQSSQTINSESSAHTDRAPQVDRPLQAYLEESATKRLAIVPLQAERETSAGLPVAALIVEQMTERPLDPSSQPLWLVAEHVAVAVDRATRLRQVPLVGPLLGVDSLRKTLTRRWLPLGAVAMVAATAAIAALILIKKDYIVRVEGQLIPVAQRYVFAPEDGVVDQLRVEHGDQVKAGDVLVSLKSAALQREQTRLRGELATANQRLAAAKTARLEARAGEPTARTQGTLASEQALVEQEIKALEQELKLLQEQQSQLTVVSPIAGQVVSWDVRQTLVDRPVARGQRLLTVVDMNGDWLVRFRVPDWRAGPILFAAEGHAEKIEDSTGIPVHFVTSANPDQKYETSVEEFRLASQTDPATGENFLLFEAAAPVDQIPNLRPGAEVHGQVSCGRRSLAYVWLGELYEELRRRFF